MTQDQECRASDEPKDEAKWTCEPQEGNANHKETGVQALLCDDVLSDLHRFGCESVDCPEASHKEDECKEEESVVDHAVNDEECDDDGIVARKVARIVGDALKGFVCVLWARDSLMIEELAERSEGGETFGAQ